MELPPTHFQTTSLRPHLIMNESNQYPKSGSNVIDESAYSPYNAVEASENDSEGHIPNSNHRKSLNPHLAPIQNRHKSIRKQTSFAKTEAKSDTDLADVSHDSHSSVGSPKHVVNET